MKKLLLLLMLITACTSQEELKIGVILPLSGPDAFFGENLANGVLLADTIIIEDTQSETSKALGAAKKLIEVERIDVLLTTISEDTEVIIPLIEEHQIPTICIACGSLDITTKSLHLFRVWPSDEIEVKAITDIAEGRVGILQTRSVWEDSLVEAFINNYAGEIHIEQANRQDHEFRTQLLKIKEFNPDFIYLPAYEQLYPTIIKQIRELNIDTTIATTSWINDPTILENCREFCEGVIVPQYEPPSEEFIALHREAYGEEPGIGADVAYDAVKIAQRCGSDLTCLQNTYHEGASGLIEFDETGDRKNRDVRLFAIKEGELQYYQLV